MTKKALYLLILLVWILLFFVLAEWRSFYCLDNGQCVTVWKSFNNVCYIIPGKYYGVLKPSTNYIQCHNRNGIILYYSEDLPNTIVYLSDEEVKVVNDDRDQVVFYDYMLDRERYKSILFLPGAKKQKEIKPNAEFISVDISENYARDKNGKIDN